MRYALRLAYDGGAFVGWQRHPGQRTVQGVVEEALAELGCPTTVQCASRTDAGVHALGQIAHFKAEEALPPDLAPRLAARLPADLRLHGLVEAPPRFHARFSARGKIYTYLVCLPAAPERIEADAFLRERVWTLPDPRSFPERPAGGGLDLPAMQAAADALRGRRDLSGLATIRRPVHDRRKTRRKMGVLRWRSLPYPGEAGGVLHALTVSGDAFLKHQIRNLVGLLVEVGYGRIAPAEVAGLVASRRTHQGPRAPGRGLMLQRVRYPKGLDPFG
ncbi:MAG: tRNA pseudouridine synthase A [Deltaproteobacteria bacterium]|nr:tRNA pseudouridine synthase A [Deltaproteobacteria bacterium]